MSTCICSASETTTINCSNNGCGAYNKDTSVKCCKYEDLQSDEFVYDNIVSNSYSRSYGTISTYSLNVQKFVVINSNISKIPKNLFQNIEQLKYLDVVNSGVRNIFVTDFYGANELTHLNLTKNAIETLEPKLFVHAQNLLVLDLSFNDITNLSEYAFDHLDKLNTLILSNNKLITFDINQRFTELEVFSIKENSLAVMGQTIFQNSSKLRDVNLRNNNLRINYLVLPSDATLESFDISNNFASISISSKNISITNTTTSVYFVHRSVEVLDASYNQISNIQFESNVSLTTLNLTNNNLTSVESLTHLHNLKQLDLSFNTIKDFGISSFSEMNDLRVLNLQKSGLTSLDFGTFSQQTQLTFLDISDNNLKKIDFDMLMFMSSLSVLYIDGNQFTNIDVSDIKSILPNLTTISISRNLFDCRDLISIMKILSSLRISLHIDDDSVVKKSSNVRGIKCFGDSSDALNENIIKSVKLSSEQIHDPNEKELHEFNRTFELLKNQFEKLSIELKRNLSALNEKVISSSNQNLLIHDNESDSFQFAFAFLLIIVILFAIGLSIFLYCKLRTKRRWYTASKQNGTSADQTLV
ncbi:hypothetical protein HA402_008927 [Bradysia odoriphaga]|nr:hypothetical protein HA402_008927 [Bradysia odoriphaga]